MGGEQGAAGVPGSAGLTEPELLAGPRLVPPSHQDTPGGFTPSGL